MWSRVMRKTVAGAGVAVLSLMVIGGSGGPASAATFSNTANISIPTVGAASPYPSAISVSGLAGPITHVTATLTGFSHALPADVDILLVGPTGKNVVLLADVGDGSAVSGLNLTFDDAAAASVPSPIVSGTYKPTNSQAFDGVSPAPGGPYGSTLSVFTGTAAAGTWNLYVVDDTNGGTGSISGGWSLNITVASISSFSPTSGKVGDTVILTGTGFTGATAVKFGNTLASTFTVDSDSQITATVPAGAGTGKIAVTTPGGVQTTAVDFVVTHARDISINLSGKKAKGTVNAKDGYDKCATSVPVNVQHLEHGDWKTVAGVLTKSDGSYKAVGLDEKGKYRSVAKKTTLSSGDICLKDISPVAKK